ncbi:MAG: imidazolonepropionase [Gemmatimonadota bacterium]
MKPKAELLIAGAGELLTCVPAAGDPAGRIHGGAVAIGGERILAAGPEPEVRAAVDASGARVIEAAGAAVAPGFVDSHTHLVFGGSRSAEYTARLTRSRREVEALGIPTGIGATVRMTRAASGDELLESALARVAGMLRFGTTTVESKSGYGLSTEHELRMLGVNARLAAAQPVDVVSTFLGAHAFPEEMSRGAYVECVIEEMLPEVAQRGLAEFCDVFLDDGYYTVAEARRILEAGREAGLRLKLHTDQYAALGGAALAAELEVVSADHLNYADGDSLRRLAEAKVTAVGTPLLDFAVRHPRPFDARGMLEAGLTLALATDLCPGCWAESMQLAIQFACRAYALSAEEALYAATVGGARALGLEDRGAIAPGLLADVQMWKVASLEEMVYRLGDNAVALVIKRGEIVVEAR